MKPILFAVAGCTFLTACLEPTQLVFDISTDIPCEDIKATAITVGVEGRVENSTPRAIRTECSPSGTLHAIGTYTVVPKPGVPEGVVGIKVAVGVLPADGGDIDVERACTRAAGYRGCVVARRQVTFVAHRTLTIPIQLYLICKGVSCDQDSTCTQAGRCVSAMVDPEKCTNGVCDTLLTRPGEGFPCNVDGSSELLCDNWCVQTTGGERTCSATPDDAGLSWQCAFRGQCSEALLCIPQSERILGRCAQADDVRDLVLCKPDEPNSPCINGGAGCTLDAGAGLLACPYRCPGSTQRKCGGRCVECPFEAVSTTACVENACVIASCRPGFAFSAGRCAWVPNYRQDGYFKFETNDAVFQYPSGVALSGDGNTMVTSTNIDGSGSVQVFVKSGGTWVRQAILRSDEAAFGDGFGTVVALSFDGSTLVVGANQEDNCLPSMAGAADAAIALVKCAADGGAKPGFQNNAGAAYVFVRTGSAWSQQARLVPSHGGPDDIFGTSIALTPDGDTAVISGPYLEVPPSGDVGANYVFRRTGNLWTQEAILLAEVRRSNDHFGAPAISADGRLIAIGTPDEDGLGSGVGADASVAGAAQSGAVMVFTWDAGTWSQSAYLKASNSRAGAFFGAVALSGDGQLLAVGAPGESSNARGLGGDETNANAPGSGAVYLFEQVGAGGWRQAAYVKASNADALDGFGSVVALSRDGGVLLVSAPGESGSVPGASASPSVNDNFERRSGAVYRFEKRAGGWLETSYVKEQRPQKDDAFGTTLGISASGDMLVVGAPKDSFDLDGGASGRYETGAAYLFGFATSP